MAAGRRSQTLVITAVNWLFGEAFSLACGAVDRIGLRLTGQRFASGGDGRRRARLGVLAVLALLAACALLVATCAQARNHPRPAKHGSRWLTLTNPIDPAQELKLPFGARSQWLQPWR